MKAMKWQPISEAAMLSVNRDGASGPCAVLLTIDTSRPGPFIRQGRFDRAIGAFVCDSTGHVLRDAVAFSEPVWPGRFGAFPMTSPNDKPVALSDAEVEP